MEYIYAELVRGGKRTLESVPAKKLPATAVLLILSGDIVLEDVPEKYRSAVRELLKEQGYDESGALVE